MIKTIIGELRIAILHPVVLLEGVDTVGLEKLLRIEVLIFGCRTLGCITKRIYTAHGISLTLPECCRVALLIRLQAPRMSVIEKRPLV